MYAVAFITFHLGNSPEKQGFEWQVNRNPFGKMLSTIKGEQDNLQGREEVMLTIRWEKEDMEGGKVDSKTPPSPNPIQA